MEYRCKICGGTLSVDRINGIAICDYCGTKQTLPQFSDESSQRLFESGNNYLLHNEYDKAENVFNQLLAINPQDPEIYWDLVLCKYGVTFVKDPTTQKFVPTCNRTHFDSVFNDKSYLSALELSSGEKKKYYQETAQTIDDIQRGIINISKKEKPFDIFISYKETNPDGSRTKDSIVAQDLYDKLTKEGYKVFFSRITLENVIGSQYEPYIYAALYSSKVMLTVSSSRENIESAWVKNEWSRFLALRQKDSSKNIIPLYFDSDRTSLPEEFDVLSAQDIKQEGFEQELVRGIKKLIPLPIMKAERRKKRRKAFGIASLAAVIAIVIAAIVMLPKIKEYKANYAAYQEAESLLTKGNYPRAAWAFADLGKFKDSQELKKEAERKWRENLANVAFVECSYSGTYIGSYYITPNGTVDCLSGSRSEYINGIDINEHGKIVSLNSFFALYEDGYAKLSDASNIGDVTNENTIKELNDIVQLSNDSTLFLKSDGTMLCNMLEDKDIYGNYVFKDKIESWKNIISFDSITFWRTNEYFVIALDASGKLHCCADISSGSKELKGLIDFAESLNNIKYFTVGEYGPEIGEYGIIAIDTNDICYTSYGSRMNEQKLPGVNSILATTIVNSDKELLVYEKTKPLLEDVVYFKRCTLWSEEYYAVTKSGELYDVVFDYDTEGPIITDTGVKTVVYDTWSEKQIIELTNPVNNDTEEKTTETEVLSNITTDLYGFTFKYPDGFKNTNVDYNEIVKYVDKNNNTISYKSYDYNYSEDAINDILYSSGINADNDNNASSLIKEKERIRTKSGVSGYVFEYYDAYEEKYHISFAFEEYPGVVYLLDISLKDEQTYNEFHDTALRIIDSFRK